MGCNTDYYGLPDLHAGDNVHVHSQLREFHLNHHYGRCCSICSANTFHLPGWDGVGGRVGGGGRQGRQGRWGEGKSKESRESILWRNVIEGKKGGAKFFAYLVSTAIMPCTG